MPPARNDTSPHGRRGPRRRVLVLAPYTPSSAGHHGGARAIAGSLWRMSAHHDIALVYLREPDAVPPLDEALRERLALVVGVDQPARVTTAGGRATALARRLAGNLRSTPVWVLQCRIPSFAERVQEACAVFDPDVVQFEMPPMVQYADAVPGRPGRVLVVQDPQAPAALERWRARPRRYQGALLGLDTLAWRRWEPSALDRVDAAIVFTEEDRRALAPGPGTAVSVVALGVDPPAQPLDPAGSQSPSVLFVGNFNHKPNVEAGRVLLEEILPAVRRSVPGLRAWLVGPDPPTSLVGASGPATEVTGRVVSVASYLDRASVVVAPLWTGGGMRVKVLETLAAGKALVATSRATAGLDVEPGRHLLVANDPDAFSAAVSSLLLDRSRRVALAQEARRWALAVEGADAWLGQYEAVWERAVAASEPRALG